MQSVRLNTTVTWQVLAEHMADGLDVRLGHVVRQITWGPHGITVRCENGAALSAQAAIVTISLGVLKVDPSNTGSLQPLITQSPLQRFSRPL